MSTVAGWFPNRQPSLCPSQEPKNNRAIKKTDRKRPIITISKKSREEVTAFSGIFFLIVSTVLRIKRRHSQFDFVFCCEVLFILRLAYKPGEDK